MIFQVSCHQEKQKSSETILRVDEVESLLFAAFKKLHDIGKRADFKSVSGFVEKHHGLAKVVAFQHLESMIAANQISNIQYQGSRRYVF